MKNVWKLFLVLSLLALALTACGGDEEATPAPTEEAAPAVDDAAAPTEEAMPTDTPADSGTIQPVRIAIVMPSSTTDLAWSQAMYDALLSVQATYGEDVVEIAYSEGMFNVTDAAAALRDYAADGFDLVIAHGTQFGTSLFEIAPDFPETAFAYGTARDTGAAEGLTNIFAYDAQAQEGGFVNGVLAAGLTESGVIGVVGPVEAGDAKLYIDGFVNGVAAVDPDIEVQIAYTGGFGDTALAAEVANTHIAAGADVLTGSAQQVVGAIGVAEEAGVYWMGTQSDQSSLAPDIVVSSQQYDWTEMVVDMITKLQSGVYGGTVYELTLGNGGLDMIFKDGLPAEAVARAEGVIDSIISGDIDPNVAEPLAMAGDEEMADEEMIAIAPVRIAIVMPSSTTDLAWSQAMFDALLDLQAEYGEDVVEIAYSEGMFNVTDAAAALRDYAADGFDLVIAHGTQFGTSLFEIAPDFPETAFAFGTARDTGAAEGLTNIFAYDAQAQEGGFINGVIAAGLTESGVIGVVGPVEAGDAKLYIDGFVEGVAYVDDNIDVQIAYTGGFGDTALAAEVANTHIAAGADVLTGSAQQVVGSIGVAEEAGVFWLGTQSDQSSLAPDIVVASQFYDWTSMLLDMITKLQSGVYGGTVYELTLANGGLTMIYGDQLPAAVVAAAEEARAAIIAGDITP